MVAQYKFRREKERLIQCQVGGNFLRVEQRIIWPCDSYKILCPHERMGALHYKGVLTIWNYK